MFCTRCGAKLENGANFCVKCGTRVSAQTPAGAQSVNPAANAPQYRAPQGQPQYQPPYQAVPQPAAIPFDFSRIPVRYRCPNGHLFDSTDGQTVCRKCGAPLQTGGLIQLYRVGNMMGVAVGMGVYIDGLPYGYLANKQSIRLCVPYGAHKVHVTHTATRACNDPVFNVSPACPFVWCKAHFSSAGFSITVEQAPPESMPTA